MTVLKDNKEDAIINKVLYFFPIELNNYMYTFLLSDLTVIRVILFLYQIMSMGVGVRFVFKSLCKTCFSARSDISLTQNNYL